MNTKHALAKVARDLNVTYRFDWATSGWFVTIHAISIIGPFYASSWGAVAVAFGMYVLTCLIGITLGYHRLLSHRSFKVPRSVERVLATIGCLAFQGGPIDWIATHRMHHAFVDTPKDPHSSNHGFWWSHLGWMIFARSDLRDPSRLRKFARDITVDPYMRWLNGIWAQMLLLTVVVAVLAMLGGWSYVVWGVFVRCTAVYHATWFINSAAHKAGYTNFVSDDTSKNNWLISILSFGEGWHNNHHAHPDVAKVGMHWWELDPTYWAIKGLEMVGLAYDLKYLPRVEGEARSQSAEPGEFRSAHAPSVRAFGGSSKAAM